MLAACFFGALAALWAPGRRPWPGWLAAGALALVVGYSRVYLGVHYATDVVGGWAAGAAWLIAARRLSESSPTNQ